MKTFKEFLAGSQEERLSNEVVVVFKNHPSATAAKLLLESALQSLEEGKTKEWGKGYSTRLDRRPENQGGDQLHIYGPQGKAWAYRYNGARSEPHKYTLPSTKLVRDIVSNTFGIDASNIEEAIVIDASQERILLEVRFA